MSSGNYNNNLGNNRNGSNANLPESNRAKIFILNQESSKWQDIGLGYPQVIQVISNAQRQLATSQPQGYLIKIQSESTKSDIYSVNLSSDLIFENPKERQITISNESTEEDIAISFQTEAGRLAFWKQIQDARSSMNLDSHDYQDSNSLIEEESIYLLPIPSIKNLASFLSILQVLSFFD